MRRNRHWALKLLSIIQENDDGGGGLFRSELRQLFEDDNSSLRLSTSAVWDIVDYHLRLLETAGHVTRYPNEEDLSIDNFELTWSGHDYLDESH